MDCPLSSRFQSSLSLLEARNYAESTLKAIVSAIRKLTGNLPESRKAALADDLAQTTSQDITDFIAAAQKAGLQPNTINTKLSILGEFFEFLREEGSMTHQPILRRRHRLSTPITLPRPMNETDLAAFFKVIDSVRDRLIFLLMLRCGLRVSEVMDGYLKTANVTKHYSPHCLRHTFATLLLNAGVQLEVLKDLMGHRSIQMTLRYAQLYDATKRSQYDQAMTKIEKRQAVNGR
jgi:site-specific recombinase XerD